MKRRDFLRTTGTFFATAALAGLAGCGEDSPSFADAGQEPPPVGTYSFPQGLASGDPRETSVVLWTRAVLASGATDAVTLTVEVANDEAFATVVVMQTIEATAATDHTVRVVISGLSANTAYYYRFVAGVDVISGRTHTAPAADADIPIRLAWVSCQDYSAGTFAAYRQLLLEDAAREAADQIRFVLHLGDFIYETRGDYFQRPLGPDLKPIAALRNGDGSVREVPPFPSGGGNADGHNFARTVDDYRHLYKTFASDADLRAARARWPFICTWDDHEFSNDCWQSQTNYTEPAGMDEGSQTRKLAANQAWFEYIPAQLTGAAGVTGVAQHAHDFTSAAVQDAVFTTPNDDNFVEEPNNVAALGSLTIYRSLRFGRHVELVVTDQRSYRSDHAIPEEFSTPSVSNPVYLDARNVLPAEDLAVMDAGRTANGGNPPTEVGLSGLPNPRIASPPGSMLGATQKQWFKATMAGSNATWKVWANEVPLMRFFIPNTTGGLIVDRVMNGDAWDGYATERTELTTYLRDHEIGNVVVLTGDIHAHFAGVVHDDYLTKSPTPVAVELCAAGISSNSLFSFYEYASRGSIPGDVRGSVTFTDTSSGAFIENLNMMVLHGMASSADMAESRNLAQALALSAPPNPHLKYADTNSQGYGVALITATQVDATLTTIERPVTNAAPVVKRAARFTVPKDNPGGMSAPVVTGTKPFPLT